MSVLCTGSVAVDFIMVYHGRFQDVILPDKIRMLNVAFHVPELRKSFGGTAANIAFNLRLLGEDPIILATVGNDFAAYGEWLDRHGIRRDWIRVLEDEATAGAYIITDLDDNQIWAFYEGAMAHAHEARVEDLDDAIEAMIREAGCVPSFKGYHGFPASACISVNEEVVHGIPSGRALVDGDIVGIDIGLIHEGWHADSAETFLVGNVADEIRELCETTYAANTINTLYGGYRNQP